MIATGKISRFAGACFVAGFIPAILAPMLWPVVLFFAPGQSGSSGLSLTAIIAIAGIAFLIGMGLCLVVGLPTILLLDAVGLNKPAISALAGAILSCAIYFFGVGGASTANIWPSYVFVAIIGACCGAAISLRTLKV